MFKQIFRRNTRQPVFALAVVLFAAVLTVVLCHLHKTGQEEQRSFEASYASVPVVFKVAKLDGGTPSSVPGWIGDLFTERGMQPNLEPFVSTLYFRLAEKGTAYYTETDENGVTEEVENTLKFAGIPSFYVAEELTEAWGGEVYWHDGYDESILATEELVCLVPESQKDLTQIRVQFTSYRSYNGQQVKKTAERTVQVVGYYIDRGNTTVYIPYEVMDQCYTEMGKSRSYSRVAAILNDNTQIAALREAASMWFAEPNPGGELTEWGRFGYEHYFFALDIDDYMLKNLESNMKNSLRLNQLASAVVFAMSAGAGFLTGFLVIRARKRDISLMRTMGASQAAIFFEFALEQLFCIALGILLGGWYTLWQPAQNLLLFGGIYFAGLTAALIVFLRRNLLRNIKDDE